ncbi:hypothetical protein SCUP234_06125 [Seiridium cupressi]
MAANTPVSKPAAGSPQAEPEEWTEEQLEDALKKLKTIHIKARYSGAPSWPIPLVQQDTLASLQKSVASAATELRDFRTVYTSEETKTVLEQAKKSRQAQPRGIKAWRARDHPDWLDQDEDTSREA